MYDDEVERHPSNEAERLLQHDETFMEMADLSPEQMGEEKNQSQSSASYTDEEGHAGSSGSRQVTRDGEDVALADRGQHVEYRVYKIRWFGLTQLILLNIVVSWDVSRSISAIEGREHQGLTP